MVPLIAAIIAIIIVILVALIIAFSAIIGQKLMLFSEKTIKANLSSPALRLATYAAAGFVWVLAKAHFPGVEASVTYCSDNRIGRVLRAAYWKSRVREFGKDVIIDIGAKAIGWENVSIGDNSWIDRNVILETGQIDKSKFSVFVKKTSSEVEEGRLKIGKCCHISKNVVIQSLGGVFIGDYSGIASGSKIYSLSHHYRNLLHEDAAIYSFTPQAPPENQSLILGSVVLEGNNALGLNSVILPGVTVGKNTWIGVCSYVVNDVPPDCVASGCPAKVTKILRGVQRV